MDGTFCFNFRLFQNNLIMTSKSILLLLLVIGFVNVGYSQCFMDRHSSTKSDSWLSCEETQSPNTTRGLGHWIAYDLGEVRKLSKMHFWNLNHPDQIDNGARTVFIDYSIDGQNWTEWGYHDFDKADGTGAYEGQEGPDLDGLEARHLLLTIRGNYGGDCFGFAELKINYSNPVTTEEIQTQLSFIELYPNPAIDQANLKVESKIATSSGLSILDATGKLVQQKQLRILKGENLFPLNLTGMADGLYLIRLSNPSFDQTVELTITSN